MIQLAMWKHGGEHTDRGAITPKANKIENGEQEKKGMMNNP